MKLFKKKAYIHDDEYYYKIARKNIRRIRLEKGLTQQDLADMVDLSRDYIADIENDKRNKHFTISVIGRIAEAYNIPIGDLFIEKNK